MKLICTLNAAFGVDIVFTSVGRYSQICGKMFIFIRNCRTVFQSGCTILCSHHQSRVSVALHPHQQLIWSVVFCFAFTHSNRYEVICHYFNLHFSNDKWCWEFFQIAIYSILFGEESIQIFVHFKIELFVFLLLSGEYLILDTDPLSDMCFANIVSQAVACVWVLLTVSFTEQKF